MLNFKGNRSANDVVITGIGMVTPLGLSTTETWQRLLGGDVAAARLKADDIDCWESLGRIPGLKRYGARLDQGRIAHAISTNVLLRQLAPQRQSVVQSERVIAISLIALQEAIQQAGLTTQFTKNQRAAILFGSSKGGLRTAESLLQPSRRLARHAFAGSAMDHSEPGAVSEQQTFADQQALWEEQDPGGAHWSAVFTTDSATNLMAELLGVTGPVICPVAACATGLISVLQGAALIQSGACDICITGSSDAALRASVLSSFHRLRVTSGHDEPTTACRPFDRDRDGFVIGEGAGVLILESRQHARHRGARPLAQVLGGGWLGDSTGMTQMDETGEVVSELLKRTASTTGLTPHVLSVHGTGTPTNDLAESRGISRAGFSQLPVCYAVKGALGHLLGAAGSVETALMMHGIHNRIHPGTTNLTTQDPDCRIPMAGSQCQVPGTTIWGKLSLGFGGHVAFGLFAPP